MIDVVCNKKLIKAVSLRELVEWYFYKGFCICCLDCFYEILMLNNQCFEIVSCRRGCLFVFWNLLRIYIKRKIRISNNIFIGTKIILLENRLISTAMHLYCIYSIGKQPKIFELLRIGSVNMYSKSIVKT